MTDYHLEGGSMATRTRGETVVAGLKGQEAADYREGGYSLLEHMLDARSPEGE